MNVNYTTPLEQVPEYFKDPETIEQLRIGLRDEIICSIVNSSKCPTDRVIFIEELLSMLPCNLKTYSSTATAYEWGSYPPYSHPPYSQQVFKGGTIQPPICRYGSEYCIDGDADNIGQVNVEFTLTEIFSSDDINKYVRGIYFNEHLFKDDILHYTDTATASELANYCANGDRWYYNSLAGLVHDICTVMEEYSKKDIMNIVARIMYNITDGANRNDIISRVLGTAINLVDIHLGGTKKHLKICYTSTRNDRYHNLTYDSLLVQSSCYELWLYSNIASNRWLTDSRSITISLNSSFSINRMTRDERAVMMSALQAMEGTVFELFLSKVSNKYYSLMRSNDRRTMDGIYYDVREDEELKVPAEIDLPKTARKPRGKKKVTSVSLDVDVKVTDSAH